MPELPEIETIRCDLKKSLLYLPVVDVIVRCSRLRYPVSINHLKLNLCGNSFYDVTRRAKYLLLHFGDGERKGNGIKDSVSAKAVKNKKAKKAQGKISSGILIIHLGMSGRLLLLPQSASAFKHEHVVIVFQNGLTLRFVDARRFGAVLLADNRNIKAREKLPLHAVFRHLGLEPLSSSFNAEYLCDVAKRRKRVTVKQLIMDNKLVVGIGNIYAAEALFLSGINPQKKAHLLSKKQCIKLTKAIKKILQSAIHCGGTTVRDFMSSDGAFGGFVHKLNVYGRGGKICKKCGTILKTIRLGQRSTVYCAKCQK